MEKVTAKELVEQVAERANLPKDTIKRMMYLITDSITKNVQCGKAVAAPGLGTFYLSERAAGIRRNPKTGGTVEVPAKRVLGFKRALKNKSL